MEALFLHLTDIHINGDTDFDIIYNRNQALCNAFLVHVTNEKDTIVFICLTGDITYSGTRDQFIYAELWLNDIIEKIRHRYPDMLIQVVAIPGNHDCDFKNRFSSTRDLLLKNIEILEEELDVQYKCTCTKDRIERGINSRCERLT